MKAIRRPDQYLRLRGDIWHYVRRVPKAVSHIDDRTLIYRSLDTDSRKVARQRRDICADADEQRWHEIVPSRFSSTPREASYRDVSHHARSLGFIYEPMDSLISRDTVTDLLHRLQALGPLKEAPQEKEEQDADALLGTAKTPSVTITEAMDLYLSEIVADELASKSPEQVKNFSKIKRRAVANFVTINGDIDMRDITREHAHAVRKFWHERIHPKDGSKPMSGSSGNKDLGSLRKLYRRYFEHIGEEERENPFRNMRFKDKILTKVMPFKDDWVRSRILAPDVFDGLNRQGALLCMALIETGCRPSELANITPENIILDAEVPHIRIRPTKDRELKSGASVRDIPLVGVALEAMRQAPNGFPHYRDRSYLLSASLTKAFKARGLFPTKQHRIYSFRHSFESRMLEAGLDFGLRCTLMGHRNPRPEYGDGGSLAYRRDELLKIAHPVSGAYKCRNRTPWYNIPSVWPAQGFIMKRSHLTPKMVINRAQVLVTDSAYRITMKPKFSIEGLTFSFYNPITLLFAELEGRFYGGGVLELTPLEFKKLPIVYMAPTEKQFSSFVSRYAQRKEVRINLSRALKNKILKEYNLSDDDYTLLSSAYSFAREHRLRHGTGNISS